MRSCIKMPALTLAIVILAAASSQARAGTQLLKVCRQITSKVSLDGSLEEWKAAAAIDTEKEGKINVIRNNKDDLSAVAYTLWDKGNFYLALSVKDDIHKNDAAGGDIWSGDSVQFAFDPTPDDPNDIFNDYEFGMALTKQGTVIWRWAPAMGRVNAAKACIVHRGGTTVYELQLPFTEMNFVPARDKQLGFTFAVNEDDGKGWCGWLEWTPGICGYKDSILFGRLILR